MPGVPWPVARLLRLADSLVSQRLARSPQKIALSEPVVNCDFEDHRALVQMQPRDYHEPDKEQAQNPEHEVRRQRCDMMGRRARSSKILAVLRPREALH
jgi:hypothetical protein